MKILGIESSAQSAGASIVEDGKVLAEFYANVGLTHSVTLLPLVEEALKFCSLKVSDMDMISVAAGPGSFTGIRIGVAAAKGLAQKDNIPCMPVSTLSGIAYPLKDSDCTAVAVMDARCHQVYTASFLCGGGEMKRITEDRAITLDELAEHINTFEGRVILIGDGTQIAYAYLKDKCENVCQASQFLRFQHAPGIALLHFNSLDHVTSGNT